MARALCVVVAVLAVLGAAAAQDLARELSSLPFRQVIGNPLIATVQAQFESAKETILFIETVGFDRQTDNTIKARFVDYEFQGVDNDGNTRDIKMSVPLLSMVPVPYLSFDSLNIEFNVALTSASSSSSSSSFSQTSSSSSSSSSWWSSSSSSSSCRTTSQSSSSSGSSTQQSYSMTVIVQAGQSDLPEGSALILDKLLSAITVQKQTN